MEIFDTKKLKRKAQLMGVGVDGGWFRWNSGHFIAFLFTRADKGRGWCREHKNDSKRSTIGTSKNKNWKVESPIIPSVLGGAGYTEKTVKGQTSNTWTSDSKTENKDVSVKLLVSIGLLHCPVHIVARVAEGQRCRNFGIAVPKEWTFNLFLLRLERKNTPEKHQI